VASSRCPFRKIAELVYSAMLTAEERIDAKEAARALHFAVRKVRAECRIQRGSRTLHDPMAWASYIHAGA
jgi:hypothetical protein